MATEALFRKHAPQMVADLVHDFRLTPKQAAAFAGNAGAESAGFTDIIEDGALAKGWAGGTGWFQWTGPRRKTFEAWLKRKGWKADSYEGNYSFLYRELTTEEKGALERVRATTTLDKATEVVWKYFERPEDSQATSKNYGRSLPARKRWALIALQEYEAKKPAPTVWDASDKESKEMQALLANPLVAMLIKQAVEKALANVASSPIVPEVTSNNAAIIAAEVKKEIVKQPEFQHATNTEDHWWQKRTRWGGIFGTLAAVAGGSVAVVPPEYQELAGLVAGGLSAIAAYLSNRAGTTTRPLFTD
jgi:hypothetical protein